MPAAYSIEHVFDMLRHAHLEHSCPLIARPARPRSTVRHCSPRKTQRSKRSHASLWAEPDIITETGDVMAGSWFANPEMCFGHELIAAGLPLTGIDRDELERWLRVGWQRSRGSLRSYDPSRGTD